MKRWQRTFTAVAGAACVGCADAPVGAEHSRDRPISRSASSAAAALVLDAADRATRAIDDPVIAGRLRGSLTRTAALLERGDDDGARRLIVSARSTLDAYALVAAQVDAADRDVIALALNGALQLLSDQTATR